MSARPGGRRFSRAALLTTAVVALVLGGTASACSNSPSPPVLPQRDLVVFAAASLQAPLELLAAAYERTTDTHVVVATGSSTALRIQLEEGARADVFLSADTANALAIEAAGLADGAIVPFAGNRLAIVVPRDNPAGISSPADLARPGLTIIAAGDSVPITRYAEQLLDRLARLPGYPPDLAAAYLANVASREDDARAVLTKIEIGEGDVAIVYATDAAASRAGVTDIEIPDGARVTAVYAGVVIAGSQDPDAAHAFLDWLGGARAQAILAEFGFEGPP